MLINVCTPFPQTIEGQWVHEQFRGTWSGKKVMKLNKGFESFEITFTSFSRISREGFDIIWTNCQFMFLCWVHGRWDLRGVDFVNIGSFCSSLLRFPSFVFYFVYGSPYFLFSCFSFFWFVWSFFVRLLCLFVYLSCFLHFILSFFAFIPCISFLLFSFLSAFFFGSLGILFTKKCVGESPCLILLLFGLVKCRFGCVVEMCDVGRFGFFLLQQTCWLIRCSSRYSEILLIKSLIESLILVVKTLSFFYCNMSRVLFPTCQVRVVRFYQSCSSPPPPPPSPPPRSPPPPLPPLPCPLPPCQLFAKLFANFRTQWPLLDLNCKGLSALGTAGPQPGTFRAQWAPLDLHLGPSELSEHGWTSTWDPPTRSEHRWTSTWDPPSTVSTAGPQPWSDRMPEDMPDEHAQKI